MDTGKVECNVRNDFLKKGRQAILGKGVQSSREAPKLIKAIVLSLVLILPSLLSSQPLYDYVNYVRLLGPETYPLRWGQSETSQDIVPSPPGYEEGETRVYPGCYKVNQGGFSIAYSFKANFAAFVTIMVTDMEGKVLYSTTTAFPTPPTGIISLDGFKLPEYIDELCFFVQWAQWQPAVTFPVYVVLEKPKPPMDPAWVSVLDISCRWARKASTWKVAADMLRNGVFNNCKYNGRKWFHRFEGWKNTEIGQESTEETFHLKDFLSQPEPLEGNCNALTNFLCCLMTSVGINAIVQRTNRIVLENGNKVGRWTFRTKLIRPAGWQSDGYGQWGYHQIVLLETEGNRIWDGNLIFMAPLAIPSDMVRENPPPAGIDFGTRAHWEAEGCETYFCKLIDFNAPYKPPPNEEGTHPNYRWETNHFNTKLTSPKLKVTTTRWENDGC